MLNWLATLLNIFSIIVSWTTLFLTLWLFVCSTKHIIKRTARLKNWLIAILCALYILAFLICRIFFFPIFESFWGAISIMVIVVCVASSRYEDCCNGKRWWNW